MEYTDMLRRIQQHRESFPFEPPVTGRSRLSHTLVHTRKSTTNGMVVPLHATT